VADQTAKSSVDLDSAHRAFEAGDFAQARRLAKAIRGSSDDVATRAAADMILKRTSLDPAIVYITVACAVFFILISFLR
jgi:hypothetical protein